MLQIYIDTLHGFKFATQYRNSFWFSQIAFARTCRLSWNQFHNSRRPLCTRKESTELMLHEPDWVLLCVTKHEPGTDWVLSFLSNLNPYTVHQNKITKIQWSYLCETFFLSLISNLSNHMWSVPDLLIALWIAPVKAVCFCPIWKSWGEAAKVSFLWNCTYSVILTQQQLLHIHICI